MKQLRRIIPLLPLAALLLLAALFLNRLDAPRVAGVIDSPLIGKPLPALNIGALPEGPFIINFFASWCAPCKIEHPHLMAMKDDGIPIIGIVFKDSPENIAAFIKKHGDPYTRVIFEGGEDAGITLGITGVPESYAVDAQKIVRARHQGPLEDAGVIDAFLKALNR